MTPLDWVVAAVGIAAIAWVNWYFFLAEGKGAPDGGGGAGGEGGGAPGRSGGNDDAER